MIITNENVTVIIQPTITVFQAAPEKPEASDLLDLRGGAQYLGMTTRKLKDLCRDKRITHSRLDYRTYRFTRADLDAWLTEYRLNRR
jgi:excisionase family DNA binding protein